jgi:hypothetical protein
MGWIRAAIRIGAQIERKSGNIEVARFTPSEKWVGTICAIQRGATPFISVTHRKYVPCTLANQLQWCRWLKSSRRTRMTETNRHDWKQLAEAARDEEDPRKLMELIQQLNRALDEHMKNQYPQASEAAS